MISKETTDSLKIYSQLKTTNNISHFFLQREFWWSFFQGCEFLTMVAELEQRNIRLKTRLQSQWILFQGDELKCSIFSRQGNESFSLNESPNFSDCRKI